MQALRLLALGLFKLVAVSDVLGLLVDEVFPHYGSYGGPMLVLAAVFYTFQLYFNFSGYSEVARAVGLLLGLTLPENFKTPKVFSKSIMIPSANRMCFPLFFV